MSRIHRSLHATLMLACALGLAAGAVLAHGAEPLAANKSCMKFSGPVLMTYTNPQTIILHIIRGKVNAATTFTMAPTTTYTRNGSPATFADIRTDDSATICAVEQLPSGVLLATWVTATGP